MSGRARARLRPIAIAIAALLLSATAMGACGSAEEESDPSLDRAPTARNAGGGFTALGEPDADGDCELVEAASCELVANDPGVGDAAAIWGRVDCAEPTRLTQLAGHRRLRVLDGDDIEGERCELGLNDHRDDGERTFHVYREGERKLTALSVRLGESFPLVSEAGEWQVVAQMKQTQPSDNGGGTPALAVHATDGRWRLLRGTREGPDAEGTTELWSTSARIGTWTRIVLEVTYSSDSEHGLVRMFVDGDGDGSFGDDEVSPTFETFTMRKESADDSSDGADDDGVERFQSIPSHLRVGVYHDPTFSCPAPDGCALEVDEVRVYELG